MNKINFDNVGNDSYIQVPEMESNFSFLDQDSKEMLRICKNGDFIVKGKKVINDIEVYEVFKEWLEKSR